MYRKFVAPERDVTVLEEVLVEARHGIIVFPDGQPVFSQLDEALYWLPTTYARSIAAGSTYDRELSTRIGRITEIATEAHKNRVSATRLDGGQCHFYLAHPFGFHAFGHLFDSLQRLLAISEAERKKSTVIHSNPTRIVGFSDHLSMFGVTSERLYHLATDVIVPKLVVVPWAAPPAQIAKENFQPIFEAYTRDVPPSRPRRLYLSRNHVRPGSRMVLNEGEVLQTLEARGFEVLRGTEPLRDIVNAFNRAEFITGAHGSLLANAMFCNPKAKIVEYCPRNRPDYSFKRKEKLTKDYTHKLIDADENFNVSLPISDILNEFGL
jgi:capsular polysaccharide biosynthesis protein